MSDTLIQKLQALLLSISSDSSGLNLYWARACALLWGSWKSFGCGRFRLVFPGEADVAFVATSVSRVQLLITAVSSRRVFVYHCSFLSIKSTDDMYTHKVTLKQTCGLALFQYSDQYYQVHKHAHSLHASIHTSLFT